MKPSYEDKHISIGHQQAFAAIRAAIANMEVGAFYGVYNFVQLVDEVEARLKAGKDKAATDVK